MKPGGQVLLATNKQRWRSKVWSNSFNLFTKGYCTQNCTLRSTLRYEKNKELTMRSLYLSLQIVMTWRWLRPQQKYLGWFSAKAAVFYKKAKDCLNCVQEYIATCVVRVYQDWVCWDFCGCVGAERNFIARCAKHRRASHFNTLKEVSHFHGQNVFVYISLH